MKELLSSNQSAILGRVTRACERAGRSPAEVELVAVTKSVETDVALALHELGARDLAENRFEGLSRKAAAFEAAGHTPRWHFVGHLQRNKARRIARFAHVLHAVDTPELVDTLGRIVVEEGWERDVYLQVKLTDEESKYGFEASDLGAALERASSHAGLHVQGLMAMAPRPVEGQDDAARLAAARTVFARLREIAEAQPAALFAPGRPRLSMGMSGDFEVAIEEGAHSVRVGRAFFEGLERDAAAGGRG